MKMIDLTCTKCSQEYSCSLQIHNRGLRKGYKRTLCKKCRVAKPPILCEVCSKETKNKRFCSRSCSATYNNHKAPKRKKFISTETCIDCGALSWRAHSRCKSCYITFITNRELDTTLQDIKDSSPKYSDYHSRIRAHARRIAVNANLLSACKSCGYTYKVICCHRKAIGSFPMTATLREVNSKDNLIGLCPTHYIEFDNGILGPLTN